MEKKVWEVSWATLWRIFLFAALIILLYLGRQILAVLAIAIIISSALDPLVSFLEKRRIPRLVGTMAAFLLAFLVLSAVLYVVLPIAVFELRSFVLKFDEIMTTIFGLNIPSPVLDQFVVSFDRVLSFFTSGDASLWNFASSFVGGLALVLACIIISFYFTIERNGVANFLKTILPEAYENQAVQIFNISRRKIGRWFFGQMILSLVVGLATGLGLWLLGVRYSLVLGLLAGLLEIVPIVGPIFAGGISILVTLTNPGASLITVLYVFLLFLAIQQMENHLLIPFVMSKAVGSHPVVILIAILTGGYLAGFLGIILAVPAAVVLQQFFDNFVRKKADRRNASLAFAPSNGENSDATNAGS